MIAFCFAVSLSMASALTTKLSSSWLIEKTVSGLFRLSLWLYVHGGIPLSVYFLSRQKLN